MLKTLVLHGRTLKTFSHLTLTPTKLGTRCFAAVTGANTALLLHFRKFASGNRPQSPNLRRKSSPIRERTRCTTVPPAYIPCERFQTPGNCKPEAFREMSFSFGTSSWGWVPLYWGQLDSSPQTQGILHYGKGNRH